MRNEGVGSPRSWPAAALVGSYELLMTVIRGSQSIPDSMSGSARIPDPLQEQATEIFADQLAEDRVPSIRAIRATLHVGQPRPHCGCGTTSLQQPQCGREIPLHEQLDRARDSGCGIDLPSRVADAT